MVNADYRWQYWQQRLLNAVDGDEVRKMLAVCLHLTYSSHSQNTNDKYSKYSQIIWWDPDMNPEIPWGWEIDPTVPRQPWIRNTIGGEEEIGS